MIKINLLPTDKVRKVKKKAEDRTQFVVAGGGCVLTFLFCTYFFWYVPNGKISQLQAEQTKATQELQRLQEQVKVVENYERDKKALEEKNRIIQELREKQGGPVHVLDDLSSFLPDRVWLKSFSEQNGIVDLDGSALSNADIVDYIGNLKRSAFFTDVELLESRQMTEKNIPIYSFKLKIKIRS